MTKIGIWQVIPVITVAFLIGCFFQQLIWEHELTEDHYGLWLGASATILAIVAAFALGERQIDVLWRARLETDARHADRKRAAFLAMVTAAWNAVERLDNRYGDTREERIRIRAVYHGDTFGSLIEALAAIPVHELDSPQAAIELAGLKKNMMEIQQLANLFVAGKNRPDGMDVLFADMGLALDLRVNKTYAELHYRSFVEALKA